MKTLEYRTINKSDWGDGPWQDEPDKKQWTDAETGLPCLIVRNEHLGILCGYVGVSKGHPLYEHGYDDANVSVHGGPTFADFCQPDSEETGVCHVVEQGEDDKVWWIGFDCGHAFDIAPGRNRSMRELGLPWYPDRETYRDFGYVEKECRSLAKQLANYEG